MDQVSVMTRTTLLSQTGPPQTTETTLTGNVRCAAPRPTLVASEMACRLSFSVLNYLERFTLITSCVQP